MMRSTPSSTRSWGDHMNLGLQKKVVVITGGGTGIGFATAMEFLREGATVVITGRRTAPLEEAAATAKAEGYELTWYSCDVSDAKALEQFAAGVVDRFGRIDIWVNNAGVNFSKDFLDTTEEDLEKTMKINLGGTFLGTKVAAGYMMNNPETEGGKGVIINMSSFASKLPHTHMVPYAASKAAVSNLTRTTADALAPYGIRVLSIIPGMIVTPLAEEEIAEYREKFTKDISAGRLGRPEDLAKPIVFLASPAAGYIAGVDIEISGGKFAVQDCDMGWRLKAAREQN